MHDLALPHLQAELDWLWAYLEAHLRRLQREQILPSDDDLHAGTMLTPTEIRIRLRLRQLADQAVPFETRAIDAAAEVSRDLEGRASERLWLPLPRLQRAFDLDGLDRLILLLALAYELEPGFARLYAFLQNHFARAHPTGALVAELLLHEPARLEVALRLAPTSRLIAHGLVEIDRRDPALAVLHCPLRPAQRLVRLALGQRDLDPDLAGAARFDDHHDVDREPILWPDLSLAIERLTRLFMQAEIELRERRDAPASPRLVVVRGAPGSGKTHLLRHVSATIGKGLLSIDLRALSHPPERFAERLAAAFREAMILDAVLVLEGFEEVRSLPGGHDGESQSELAYRLARLLIPRLARHRGVVVWGARDSATAVPPLDPPPEVITLPTPDARAAEKLWRRFLPPASRGEGAEPDRLAQLHRLPPGFLTNAVEHARRRLPPGASGRLSAHELHQAIKVQMQHRLGDSATLISTHHSWDDLVVPNEVKLQLQEIIERHRQRVRVLEEWGLGDRVGKDVGMPVLFDGPPGTGKTMSAGLIGRQLDLDVYQVDLSRMVSKWIGETEKNLARLFDEAERSRAILLFDEADSLFAKRTGVESSNDRYANLEVNFLLQRVERFSGIAILTTNFPESIDEAFKRRITLRVTFERPGPREREALWRSILRGPRLPLSDDIDFASLARDFELTGGLIKNAALRAAFIAASQEIPIDHDALESSALIELKKHGSVVRASAGRGLG